MTPEEELAWWQETHRRMARAIELYIGSHEVESTDEPTALELLLWCRAMRDRTFMICAHCNAVMQDPDTHQCEEFQVPTPKPCRQSDQRRGANRMNILQQMSVHKNRVDSAKQDIVQFSRSLVATLKDAGREHAAKEIERLLFVLDSVEGEFLAFIEKDPVAVLSAMFPGKEP